MMENSLSSNDALFFGVIITRTYINTE